MADRYEPISDQDAIERMRREQAQEELRSAVERIIDEAQKQGAFDDLPGKGKPLPRKNPYAGDQALAFELLQNNQYTLPWIADRKEIRADVIAFRAELRRAWLRTQAKLSAPSSEAESARLQAAWSERLEMFAAEIAALNKRIVSLNLAVPVARLELLKLNMGRELERAGARDVL